VQRGSLILASGFYISILAMVRCLKARDVGYVVPKTRVVNSVGYSQILRV
jgi:hypothetical protein